MFLFSASIVATDFKADSTAESFSSRAERDFFTTGSFAGSAGEEIFIFEEAATEPEADFFAEAADFKAAIRSRFIFSARAWRRFRSSARRFAIESIVAALVGFLTYFRFRVVERWTERWVEREEVSRFSTGFSELSIFIYYLAFMIL